MKAYLSDIKQIIGRGARLSSDVVSELIKKYGASNSTKFNAAISRYIKEGLIYCSRPLTFNNGVFALSHGRSHDYTKYYPLVNKYLPGLSKVLDIIRNGIGYISIFNLKKLLVIDENKEEQLLNAIEVIKLLVSDVSSDNEYCYRIKKAENDKQDLYEKNRDRILYTVIKKHEKENIIFGNSVYYKTSKYNKISAAYLTFDAYSKSTVFQESEESKAYITYDFAIDGKYSTKEAHAYIERVKKLSKRFCCKVVPISIFESADEKTRLFLKAHGIIIVDFKSIFGKSYLEILNRLSLIDQHTGSVNDFEYVLRVVSEYEQFDSIKGGLFEHLCLAILSRFKTNNNTKITCDFHLKRTDSNVDLAQYDIVIKTHDQKTIICECKAYSSKLLLGNHENYGTISYILKQVNNYKERYPNEEVEYIIFSGNGFVKSFKTKESSKVKLSASEYNRFLPCCDYEFIETLPEVVDYALLWRRYYLNGSN